MAATRLLLGLVFAAVVWLIAKRALRWFPHRWRPAALAAVTLLVLAALNAVNFCAPGWCGWYGFPFPYHSWSDAMVTLDGVCVGCPAFTLLAAAADVAFAVVLCIFFYRRERRSSHEHGVSRRGCLMGSFLASLVFVTLVSCSPNADSQAPPKPTDRTGSAAITRAPETVEPQGSAPLAPMRIGNGVTAPIVIKRVDPDYKQCAGEKLSGFPILEAVIDEQGVVRNPRLLKKVHPCLEKATIDAIHQWRFRPGTFNGKPVAVEYNFTVRIHYR